MMVSFFFFLEDPAGWTLGLDVSDTRLTMEAKATKREK